MKWLFVVYNFDVKIICMYEPALEYGDDLEIFNRSTNCTYAWASQFGHKSFRTERITMSHYHKLRLDPAITCTVQTNRPTLYFA